MPRTRREIMKDLHAILAELNYCLEQEEDDGPRTTTDNIAGVGTGDLSPKLAQALARDHKPEDYAVNEPRPVSRETRASMPTTAERAIESHEDIRAKARAFKPAERHPQDSYRESYDPGFDEAVFMGTGDRRED